jgi:YVTN family beta-propeller protein
VTGSTVVVFDARDSTAPDSVIHVGGDPTGIAFTPDGRFAYVANETSGTVSVVNTATRTVPTFVPANTLPNAACGLAITPDGAKIVVIGGCGTVTSGGIGIIDTATNTATPITGLTSPNDPYEAVAMAPDGTKAYAYDRMKGDIEVVDPRTGTAASTPLVHGLAGFEGLAVSPDGKFLFATASLSGGAVRIDTTTGTRTTISPVATKPWAAAITPDQPPHAAFSVTLGPLGTATAFDASATTTSDGGPATYTWDFGDGPSATTATPSTSHVYSQPGSYTATLTVTDDQGCSTTFVYTGQTALCNGGSSAVAARNVTILPARTLTVSVSGRGKVTGTGISCPGDCSQAYADGTHVTLTATPTASSRFKGWGGACRGSGNCKLNMKADKSVSAKFGASPPDTRITKARIVRRTAKFKFKPIGNATGVQCELKRKHGHKKPRFRRCKSPKAYKHLKKGKYTFKVRAFSSAGPDPTPARKRFKVK